jgi:hypothetical protein
MDYAALVTAVSDYTENTFPTVNMNVFITQAETRIYNAVQLPSLRKNVYGQVTASNKYLQCPTDFLSVFSLAIITDVTGVDLDTGTYEFLLNKDVNFIRQAYPTPNDKGVPRYYGLFGPRSDNVKELTFILGPTPFASYWTELHYYYYPESIIQRPILTLGAITAGTSYTTGTYSNVSLTGGSGSNAVATIVVSGGGVTSVTVTNGGTGFVVGDTMSALSANIGGTGSGFSIPVATVGNSTGTTWLGDNYDPVLLYATLVEAYTYMKGEQDMVMLYNTKFGEALIQLKRLGDGLERQDAYRSGQVRIAVT